MKALLLVGGFGTRLRPLTLSVPKPLIQFCNQPIIEYQISALKRAGVDHIILAIGYQPGTMYEAVTELSEKYSIRITTSIEKEPYGTGGAIKFAQSQIEDQVNREDSFWVINSDIICSFPFESMQAEYNKLSNVDALIMVTRVDSPSNYGVVIHDDITFRVSQFIEKPESFCGSWINGGIYLLSSSIFERIPLCQSSIEREIFPSLARRGTLYCSRHDGYWADIGKPVDYLSGMQKYLQNLSKIAQQSSMERGIEDAQKTINRDINSSVLDCHGGGTDNIGNGKGRDSQSDKNRLEKVTVGSRIETSHGPVIHDQVLIDKTSYIHHDCEIGPNVTIGANCKIHSGCRIANAAILDGTHIQCHTLIRDAIIGWRCNIGTWVRIENMAVLGQDVTVMTECHINGALILPHKIVDENILNPGTIIM